MNPILRLVEPIDVEVELSDMAEFESDQVGVALHIGANQGPGTDLFYATFIGPRSAAARSDEPRGRPWYLVERGVLVLREFSHEELTSAIEDILSASSGETWADVAAKLCRYFLWEFDGMDEAGGLSQSRT